MAQSAQNPIVIRDRKELIYLLSEAATLEHMIMCQYLYVSFALKKDTNEDVTPDQLEAIQKWNKTIVTVAEQEMLHLALDNNLLTSLGAAPYFSRPNFPLRSRYFPSRVRLALMPLDETCLSYFLYLERPEKMAIQDVPGFSREGFPVDADASVPVGQEFATVGQLYRGIEEGIESLVKKLGEERVFIGSATGQATPEYFWWPELTAVTDLISAKRAIETIVTEGEGARGDWKNSHFGKFLEIQTDYVKLKKRDPNFDPSRPVLAAFSRAQSNTDETTELIDNKFTAAVSDLFNGTYQVLLQILARFFLQVETSNEELRTLSNSSVELMMNVIKPLGHLLTTLPIGPNRPGLTAGPVFETFTMSDLLTKKGPTWIILNERLADLSNNCRELGRKPPGTEILLAIADVLNELAGLYKNAA